MQPSLYGKSKKRIPNFKYLYIKLKVYILFVQIFREKIKSYWTLEVVSFNCREFMFSTSFPTQDHTHIVWNVINSFSVYQNYIFSQPIEI